MMWRGLVHTIPPMASATASRCRQKQPHHQTEASTYGTRLETPIPCMEFRKVHECFQSEASTYGTRYAVAVGPPARYAGDPWIAPVTQGEIDCVQGASLPREMNTACTCRISHAGIGTRIQTQPSLNHTLYMYGESYRRGCEYVKYCKCGEACGYTGTPHPPRPPSKMSSYPWITVAIQG